MPKPSRILTQIEAKYAKFDGLNLSWETLEGIAKHNGPVTNPPRALANYVVRHDLELNTYAGPEAQVAAYADDIAYNNHDMEDGLRAEMFTLDELAELPLLGDLVAQVRGEYGELSHRRASHEVIRRMINRMVTDLIDQSKQNISDLRIASAADVRAACKPLVHFSAEMESVHRAIKSFLMQRMYRHFRVNRMTSKARRVVSELFAFFIAEPECLPNHWQKALRDGDTQHNAEMIGDFIAGMTDRFAIEEHQRIFDVSLRT